MTSTWSPKPPGTAVWSMSGSHSRPGDSWGPSRTALPLHLTAAPTQGCGSAPGSPIQKPQASHQGRLVCLWPGKQGREGKAVPSGALTASSLVCGQEDQRKPVTVGEHERLSKCFQILSSVGTISTNICFHFYKVPPLPQVPHSSNPS